ncbi:MAG: ArnT family glycosyltransferase [Acidimicrobiia bacterium]
MAENIGVIPGEGVDRPGRAPRMLYLAIVVAGLLARVVALDRLPGISGDEAWFGVNVYELLDGGTPFLLTPTGNIVSPIHSLPLLLLARVSEPALWLLRVPSVIWGGLAVVLAYPLLARPIGARAALLVTAFLALSTATVGQSRLGWDPSATPFFALLAVACALRDRPVLAGLSWLPALVVHPTNAFLAPVIAAAWAPFLRVRYAAAGGRTRTFVRLAVAAGVVAGGVAALAVVRYMTHRGQLSSPDMVERAFSPASWLESVLGVERLFSGVTTATYVGGVLPGGVRVIADGVIPLVLLAPLALSWRALKSDPGAPILWLLGGVAASAIPFHVVAGPDSLRPGDERFAMFLVVPLALVGALGAESLRARWRHGPRAVGVVGCATLTLVLVVGYFQPLASNGGESHQTFRTGGVEPKAAAFAFMADDSRGAEVVAVLAENWWVYWPLRYLSHREGGRLRVEMMDRLEDRLRPDGVAAPPYPHPPDRIYAVTFEGGPAWSALSPLLQPAFTAVDPHGRPILHVTRIPLARVEPLLGSQPWSPLAAQLR